MKVPASLVTMVTALALSTAVFAQAPPPSKDTSSLSAKWLDWAKSIPLHHRASAESAPVAT